MAAMSLCGFSRDVRTSLHSRQTVSRCTQPADGAFLSVMARDAAHAALYFPR
jgi:hypothetical protein